MHSYGALTVGSPFYGLPKTSLSPSLPNFPSFKNINCFRNLCNIIHLSIHPWMDLQLELSIENSCEEDLAILTHLLKGQKPQGSS